LGEAVARAEAEGLDNRVAEQAEVDRRRGVLASAPRSMSTTFAPPSLPFAPSEH
jgi:hypothetical protein